MKLLIIVAITAGLFTPLAFGQGAQADQIKRRAKELSNQNNVRQGVPPPTQAPLKPATTPTTPVATQSTAPAPLTQQQHIAKLKADLAVFKAGAQVTAQQKQRLVTDLHAAARGANRPSVSAVTKLVNDLALALPGKAIEPPEQSRLAQNLEAIVNGANLSPAQTDAIVADVQATLQVCGAKRSDAVNAANDVKAIAADFPKSGPK